MSEGVAREVRDFLDLYERRTNTHDFEAVREFIDPDAVYWFSDGVHEGIREIQQAFEQTWDAIRDEVYSIEDVRWLTVDGDSASCIYTFHWKGTVDGQVETGSGRGTCIVHRHEGSWKIVQEHLSV